MKKTFKIGIVLFTLFTLHFTLFADVPQAITYRGVCFARVNAILDFV